MDAGLSESDDRSPRIPAGPRARRGHLEQQFVDKVRAMNGLHLTATDGVERAALELVNELREEGLEQALLVLKSLVTRCAAVPQVLIGEIVPRTIVYYYKTGSGQLER